MMKMKKNMTNLNMYYEKEDDAEDLEAKEQQTIDDMAIDSYDEEDEE